MRTHPEISLRILSTVPAFDAFAFTAAAHHERLDGSGYPYGVTGTKLDLPARILAVADVAEALSAERPYRPSLPWDEVLAIIGRDAGSRLDARIVAALADRPEADALDLWQPALPSSPGTRAAR
jgi:HD-GYP domain-containing protein (c-di-GMP phosphodiesterase class II)